MAVLTRSNVRTILTRIVKPYVATPPALRVYKFSSLDQAEHNSYIPMGFFYPRKSGGDFPDRDQILNNIQSSLAKALSYYYPLAGRIVENDHIDCNDAGAELIEARLPCSMSEFLRNTDSYAHDLFLPEALSWDVVDGRTQILVQLTHFDCSGFSLGVCMSHKIADALSFVTFIKDWATIARHPDYIPSPAFVAASIFPPLSNDTSSPALQLGLCDNPISRRLIFRASEIEKLKDISVKHGFQRPTRVQVVTALLYNCAVTASTANSGLFRPSVLVGQMNLRPFINPPLPDNTFGNMVRPSYLFTADEKELMFEKLVGQYGTAKAAAQTCYQESSGTNYSDLEAQARSFQGERGDINWNMFYTSSICRFPYYDVNFGWGRPLWATLGRFSYNHTFTLMDLPNRDGIEVLITMDKGEMEVLEQNQILRSFVSSTEGN